MFDTVFFLPLSINNQKQHIDNIKVLFCPNWTARLFHSILVYRPCGISFHRYSRTLRWICTRNQIYIVMRASSLTIFCDNYGYRGVSYHISIVKRNTCNVIDADCCNAQTDRPCCSSNPTLSFCNGNTWEGTLAPADCLPGVRCKHYSYSCFSLS